MTSLTNFCHNYHVTPSRNKRRTFSTVGKLYSMVLFDIFKAENYHCCYHSLIYFSKGEADVKATEPNFFQSFFFLNLMLF